MIFSTYSYALFLAVVFVAHWALPRSLRPWLLVGASYYFYATWNWRYLPLLLAVSLFNWAYARIILASRETGPLWPGVAVNLAVLGYFKYMDFFTQNIAALARAAGLNWHPATLGIALPLGVSFFTFQGVAYLVDVASGEEPFTLLRDFLMYKGFWPQLIAGPIVRLSEIREQIEAPSALNYEDVSFGTRRILQGAFKKIVLADALAPQVELAFLGTGTPHALDTITGVVGFGLQIYFDFSAYTDFAIGSARLFGFRFPENFDWPYLARSPQEFWNRWHTTLSRWIRDYTFTPLTFATRRHPHWQPLWLIVAMALCGLWHGAQWTFVLWGAWHGLLLVAQQSVLRGFFSASSRGGALLGWLVTMIGVFAGWLLFRAPNLDIAMDHLKALITMSGGLRPALVRENGVLIVAIVGAATLLASLLRDQLRYGWQSCLRQAWLGWWLRPVSYSCLFALTIVLDQEAQAFVYFQF